MYAFYDYTCIYVLASARVIRARTGARAVPYLQVLAETSDIISISEHWLWPFELHTLDKIFPGYSAHGCSDKRLSESSTLVRGYGGVAVLWKSSLRVTAVKSDRCVAIQVCLTNCSLSIINVYLPTSDYPLDIFKEYLHELENTISALQSDGPVMVLEDFNAHLGSLGGQRGIGEANPQGKLLLDLICRTNLFVASLCSISSGPSYTFFGGAQHTTVDYCLLDNHAAHILQECVTLDHHPLNLSDHLPLSVCLDLTTLVQNKPPRSPKTNWKRAISDGSIEGYQQQVSTYFSNLLTHHNFSDLPIAERTAQLDHEIRTSAEAILQAAQHSLPCFKPRRQKKKDTSLHAKCCASKAAWDTWSSCGRPRSGPLYEEMCQRKKDVRSHVRSSRAREERSRLQERDRLFRERDSSIFNNTSCRKLVVNNTIVSDEHELLESWANHFRNLSSSRLNSESTQLLYAKSFDYSNYILEAPFEVEEIESVIRKLKCGKSGGADGLQPEHIKYGGHSITLWFQSIFNNISTLEDLPPCLKLDVTIPVFKGKGRDPLNPDNYRGITLTSVISKSLELVLLSRLESVLMDKGFPHHGQTAYRKGISCADAIFSTQEAVLQRMRDGKHPTLCCFDLEKAFDSIEYPVLLEHLFKLGINGKCWRLLHNWYSNSRSVVRLNSNTSQCFPVCRGVKQGSVLSPTLFIIVIDSLLTSLDTTH